MEEFNKTPNSCNAKEDNWNRLLSEESKYQDYEFPLITIVIATYNASQNIITTLDSVLGQNYPDFEVLIIDADSTDRTLETIKSYRNKCVKVFSVSKFQRYEMFNRGISQAAGFYINFLTPGDFYLHRNVLRQMMTLALDRQRPELVYCATLLRVEEADVRILYRDLSMTELRQGHQPTSIQSCWFQKYAIVALGKFNSEFEWRGGLDLFCRFHLTKQLRAISTYRVLNDYNFRIINQEMVVKHFTETSRIIYKYFGALAFLKWLVHQKDVSRYFGMWIKNLKIAFFGK